jgi:hypothetical protein
LKKRVSVLFLSFLLVVSLLQCYAAAEKKRNDDTTRDPEYARSVESVLTPQQYSSYFGGSENDELTSFVFVEPNIVYLAGTTSSNDIPGVNGYQDTNAGGTDCFVMKIDIDTDTVIYSTYVGGSGGDLLYGIRVDDDGNLYATGHTTSPDFPTVNPFQTEIRGVAMGDAFVFKLNPTGDALIYSTYFGTFGGTDKGASIDFDEAGNAYVLGYIMGGIIDLVNPFDDTRVLEECFLLKFNSTGNGLDCSSYYGGSENEKPITISLDDNGNVYLFGSTESDDLPGLSGYDTSHNGAWDCFVTKINSTLTGIEYSTYIGGSGIDETSCAVVDSSGTVYVTGYTSSSNFPTVEAYADEISGVIDCFVFSMDPDGNSLSYSTYLGGSGLDYGLGITTNSDGAVLFTGYTTSSDFPATSGIDSSLSGETDCFVSKLNLSTSALDYSTYLGGSGDDTGTCVAFGADETMIVAGYTDSEDFPTDATHQGDSDWFLYEIPETLPPPGFPVDLLLYVGIGVGAVVFIAAVVCLKRR